MRDAPTAPNLHDEDCDSLFTLALPETTFSMRFVLSALSPDWQNALRTRDARACHERAVRAGATKDGEAVAGLCALVETLPDTRLMLMGRRKAWRWARVAGISALARIGNTQAIPTLVRALFDPDPHIRETAAYELPAFGPNVVPVLRQTLRESSDWTLTGMQAAIHILETMGEAAATVELAHVVREQLPGDPTRWARQTFARPFTLVSGLFLALWGVALFTVTSDPTLPLWESSLETGIRLAVAGFVPLVFVYMLLVCVVFLPLLNLRAARERGMLARAALQALGNCGDKRPLPLLIETAFGSRTDLARTARAALRHLLPLLDVADAENLPAAARHQLAQALGKTEPETDLVLLNALEYVGNGHAAQAVAVLAQNSAAPDVRARATQLLPVLQERLRMETARTSLLRPTHKPCPLPTELLRAADALPAVPPEQMLRSSAVGDISMRRH